MQGQCHYRQGAGLVRVSAVIGTLMLLGMTGCARDAKVGRLASAAEACDIRAIKTAIAAGDALNPKDSGAAGPMEMAVAHNCSEGARLLIAAGADANQQLGPGKMTPLLLAAMDDSGPVAKVLIAAGADVNARDEFGMTALTFAVRNGDASLATALIDAKADVNAKGVGGQTPLLIAVTPVPNPAMVKLLIDGGADVNTSQGSETILAAMRINRTRGPNEVQVEKLLLAHGAHE